MTKVDDAFFAAFRERVAAQEISRFWQLELEEVGPGWAKVSMVCRPEMANIMGMVHGSAIFALIDEAFQAAVNGHGTVAVALNMNLTFHAAPKMGERLTAMTRELHVGRRTATYFIEVTDPKGGLIASCQALAYRKDTPLEFAQT
jgi:acyl-CoA thioesterase